MSRLGRRAFWAAVLGLCATHLDVAFVSTETQREIVGGWIPFDLAYHLAWILVAAVVVFVMAGPMWEEAP
jgi:uncharacterized membrane protein YhaH (DUF805 family)